jgi:hypothetical protein
MSESTTIIRTPQGVTTQSKVSTSRGTMTLTTVGDKNYIVTNNGKIVRRAMCSCALEAREVLKPTGNEELFIRVGG